MTLTEFLLARIAEDNLSGLFRLEDFPAGWADHALRALALPYADHPDYQPEWKP
jgi:hypothetical protein